MGVAVGARLGAGVLGILGGSLALVIGIVMVLFGGTMEAVTSTNGASLAVSGGLAMFFGLAAIFGGVLFLLPSNVPAMVLVALNIAALLWAFARVDAIVLGLIPVVPLAFSALLGLAGGPFAWSPVKGRASR